MEEFNAFDIKTTYTKGDAVTFNYDVFIFLPDEDQPQFSIGLSPDEGDGWCLWIKRDEDI